MLSSQGYSLRAFKPQANALGISVCLPASLHTHPMGVASRADCSWHSVLGHCRASGCAAGRGPAANDITLALQDWALDRKTPSALSLSHRELEHPRFSL